MKAILTLLTLALVVTGCKVITNDRKEVDIDYVITKFKEHSSQIEKVEYNIQRIDTFAQGGTVWNNKGVALLERDEKDNIFGYSFYAKRNDIQKEYIYDKGKAFEFSRGEKTYKVDVGHYGFLGKPGGQMVAPHIFYLDSVYTSAELVQSEDRYILKYKFNDNTTYNVTDQVKVVELDKSNFFPTKIISSYKILSNKAVQQMVLSDVRINHQVNNSIASFKAELVDFEIIQPAEKQQNKLLGSRLPQIKLPNLLNDNQIEEIKTDKLLLIDFWEVWCGQCIKSFPDVEKIKKSYPDKLLVIGIVSENKEKAIELASKKGITFHNLIGNEKLLKEYSVNSFPRYFLVDTEGIVRKEYEGFSDQIELDIKQMIVE